VEPASRVGAEDGGELLVEVDPVVALGGVAAVALQVAVDAADRLAEAGAARTAYGSWSRSMCRASPAALWLKFQLSWSGPRP
jgi:hypothetical protein